MYASMYFEVMALWNGHFMRQSPWIRSFEFSLAMSIITQEALQS